MAVDGSIRIETKIDNKGIKADLYDLEKMLDKTSKNIETAGQTIGAFGASGTKAATRVSKSIGKLKDELADVEAQIKSIQDDTDASLQHAVTDKQTITLLEMEQIALDKLIKKRDELKEKLAEYEAEQAKAAQKQAEREAGQAFDLASKEVSAGVADQAFIAQISSANEYKAALRATQEEMKRYEAEAERVAAARGIDPKDLLSANQQYQNLAQKLKLLTANAGKFKTGIKSAFASSRKEAKTFGDAIQTITRRIGRMGLAVFGVRSAFSAMSRVTSTYLANNQAAADSVAALSNTIAEMFGPAIEYVIRLLMTGMAYLNAFVQGLTGIDFVARANAKALGQQAEATTALAEAEEVAKRQSAGFDEQTKLSDTSANAASGGEAGATGSGDSVPQLTLPEINTEWAKRLAEAGQWVKENFDKILVTVLAIEAGLLAWRIAEAFGASILQCAGWFAIISGAITMIYGLCDAWINGLDWGNFFAILGGGTLVVGGLGLVFGSTGAAIGALVAGVTMVVLGIKDLITNGPNLTNIILIAVGAIAAITAGFWLFNGSLHACPLVWIIDGIVALIAVIALVVVYWDDITAAVQKCWKAIVNCFGNVADWFAGVFAAAWNGIKSAWSATTNFFAGVWQGIKCVFSTVGSWFANIFTTAWNGIKKAFSGVSSFFQGIWNTIKAMFSKIGTTIGNAIGDAFKTVVNAIIGFAEKTINSFIKAINVAISVINAIPGVEIKKLELLEIPRLARGGIVNNPGRGVPAIIGEAGREAVLPLENNTEWMDLLAERLNGGERNIVVQVILSGKKIHEEIIKLSNKRDFATNGAM